MSTHSASTDASLRQRVVTAPLEHWAALDIQANDLGYASAEALLADVAAGKLHVAPERRTGHYWDGTITWDYDGEVYRFDGGTEYLYLQCAEGGYWVGTGGDDFVLATSLDDACREAAVMLGKEEPDDDE